MRRSRTGTLAFHSVEEVRVAITHRTRTVVVAWVQGDTRTLPNELPKDNEGAFAEENVWPKFDALLEGP